METCPRCNARVTADATWCNQCFSAIDRSAPATPGTGALAANRPSMRVPIQREPGHEAVYSRWRGGATSLGPVGRIGFTILALFGLAIGYPILRGLILVTMGMDVPGSGFLAMYLTVAITGGLFLMSKIWRSNRIS
jgi:hypothetical protein